MKNTKRKGFTLVELLIVIVVIGVLSAMMMLSSTEAVSSAKAADIISDLRNLKTAALAWYADNIDYVDGKVTSTSTLTTAFSSGHLNGAANDIAKYLGSGGIGSGYTFSNGVKEGEWFVWYAVTDKKVAEKLKSRASSVGLCRGTANNSASAAESGDITVQTTGTTYVGMFIR